MKIYTVAIGKELKSGSDMGIHVRKPVFGVYHIEPAQLYT